MNILLIGSGAREHALARAIKKSPQATRLFCFASSINPGIVPLCDSFLPSNLNDVEAMVKFAENHAIDLAIIGPEAPLALGVVDRFKTMGIQCIGPTKKLAQIETSKGFTRDLLSKYNVPGMPAYQRFEGISDAAQDFLTTLGDNYVIKADGLMGGKGVKVAGEHLHSHEEALAFCREINSPFVIEEKLFGPEFSLISFSDGTHCAHMPAVQDHKRAYENDTGPNTGGMGSYSDANHSLPFLTEQDIAEAHAINEATVKVLKTEFNEPYQGILYGGFMRTPNGVKLIEYNARFGDPEAINLLALLESDFVALCQAMVDGTLTQELAQFSHEATVVKYIVPEGYPDKPVKNQAVDISAIERPKNLYFAAIDQQDSHLIMTGSRAIAVLGQGDTLAQAEQHAEQLASQIKGPVFYRQDIGTQALIDQRIAMVS